MPGDGAAAAGASARAGARAPASGTPLAWHGALLGCATALLVGLGVVMIYSTTAAREIGARGAAARGAPLASACSRRRSARGARGARAARRSGGASRCRAWGVCVVLLVATPLFGHRGERRAALARAAGRADPAPARRADRGSRWCWRSRRVLARRHAPRRAAAGGAARGAAAGAGCPRCCCCQPDLGSAACCCALVGVPALRSGPAAALVRRCPRASARSARRLRRAAALRAGARARLPRSLAERAGRGLPARAVVRRLRARRQLRRRPRRRAARSSSTCPRRTPTSSSRWSPRSSGWSACCSCSAPSPAR